VETILGINCFKHDASASLLVDGVPVAAVEEERLSRVKHDGAFPGRAIRHCLAAAGIEAEQLDHVAFYMLPGLVFRENLTYWPRHLLTGGGLSGLGFWGSQLWAGAKMRSIPSMVRELLGHELGGATFHFVEHHPAHAAAGFFASGFESAALLTLDGVGERDTGTAGTYDPDGYRILRRMRFPHSPGFFYSAVTDYLGFRPDNDEYKVMGLASYGKPTHLDLFRKLISVDPEGMLKVDTGYFTYQTGNRKRYFGEALVRALGPARETDGEIEQHHADIAHSAQKALEEAVLQLARELREETGETRLVISGGVGLNCVMNGRLLREAGYREMYPMPAPHDAGTSLGAAWHVDRVVLGNRRPLFEMPHLYLGPAFDEAAVEEELRGDKISFTRPDDLPATVASLLEQGKVVGWFQGGAEFGPRALGNRSIIADPRRTEMQDLVNACVKRREEFRPFAPSVLEEKAGQWFTGCARSPHMILVFDVPENLRDQLPAVTHVDGTARVHTVSSAANPLYHQLIGEFEKLTGVPVILNTSFNVKGEPIVTTPREAVRTFFGTGMDALAIGPFLVQK
jgi:carbamoyltransferase